MTSDDIRAVHAIVKEQVQTYCDGRFRTVDDCNEITGKADERQDKMEKAFTESNTKLNALIGILVFIASTVIPACLKFIGGG